MNVLIVDKDLVHRKVLERVLERGGHQAFMAENVEKAKEIFNVETIQIVVTDWKLPDHDGLTLVRWVREQNVPRYVYIILFTAEGNTQNVVVGLNSGADDYLIKPMHTAELLARIEAGERFIKLERDFRMAQKRLEDIAMLDDLTGLMNRRAIYRIARQEMSRSRRQSSPLSILFIDVDGFKEINDHYGHLFGDETLKMVSNLIRDNIRPYDQAGRWAGDEFIVLLPDSWQEQSGQIGIRILAAAQQKPLSLPDGVKIFLKLSIGIHTWIPLEGDESDLDALVKFADHAMYQAKQAGGARITFSEE